MSTGVWTEHHPALLPGPRNLYGATASLDNDQWFLVGGNTAAGPNGETWAYTLDSGEWSQPIIAGPVPTGRYSADTAFTIDGLFMFGGHDGASEIGDLWRFTSNAT